MVRGLYGPSAWMSNLFVLIQLNVCEVNICNVFSHILQGQASGLDTLISLLNSCKDLQFWAIMAQILGSRNLTEWILHRDLYFRKVIKVHYQWSTPYFSNKQRTRSSIREYCWCKLKFAPDRLEAGRRSLLLSIRCNS